MRVEFDPKKVSYDSLVELFFGLHNPAQFGGQGADMGDQYRAAVFYHSDAQRDTASKWVARTAEKLGKKVSTQVVKAGVFWMAEDYHQQYYMKNGVAACPVPTKSGGG